MHGRLIHCFSASEITCARPGGVAGAVKGALYQHPGNHRSGRAGAQVMPGSHRAAPMLLCQGS